MHRGKRRTAVVLLTFTIGVLNVCLGYALAVCLGYGPPSLEEGWGALRRLAGRRSSGRDAQDRSWANPFASGGVGIVRRGGSRGITVAMVVAVAVAGCTGDVELDETFVETNILKFSVAILRSGARMREIGTRLRSSEGHWDAATVEACLAELEKDTAEYLDEQGQLAEQLHDRMAELGDMAAVGEQVEAANLAAVAELETTISHLKRMDFHGDPTVAGNRLLEEIDNLGTARHNLRDDQEAAFLAVARHQNRLGQIDPRARTDCLTGLLNRIGLGTALWQWWEEGFPQERRWGPFSWTSTASARLRRTWDWPSRTASWPVWPRLSAR